MGVTDFSIKLLETAMQHTTVKRVVELGAQNLYTAGKDYGKYADHYYKLLGIEYTCIDVSKENSSLSWDLSRPVNDFGQAIGFDLVTDFGTSEHVGDDGKFGWEAIYNCWLTKHRLLRIGGVMVSENPKTGNWPGHGFNYYSLEFYSKLQAIAGYTVIDIGENAAMGNITDGWNVYCIMKKTSEVFPTLEQFMTLPLKTS
jgi:hypothetical protein